jgi:hypothetical protein
VQYGRSDRWRQSISRPAGTRVRLIDKELEFICPIQKCSLSKIKLEPAMASKLRQRQPFIRTNTTAHVFPRPLFNRAGLPERALLTRWRQKGTGQIKLSCGQRRACDFSGRKHKESLIGGEARIQGSAPLAAIRCSSVGGPLETGYRSTLSVASRLQPIMSVPQYGHCRFHNPDGSLPGAHRPD